MENIKQVGIWMDHASAHIIEFPFNVEENQLIISRFTNNEKERSLSHGESKMHNAEQHEEHEYFKKIGKLIRDYKEVLLFGPTQAKTELLNILNEDHNFSEIKISIEHTDKMTDQEEKNFVKNFFLNPHSKEKEYTS